MEYNQLWNFLEDWRYLLTVIFCTPIGILIGWYSHKDRVIKEKRAEDLVIAIKNTIVDGNVIGTVQTSRRVGE